jgi:hypothetical protein
MYDHFRQFEDKLTLKELAASFFERAEAAKRVPSNIDDVNEWMRREHEMGVGSPCPMLARQYGWAEYGSKLTLPSYLRVVK